MGLKFFDYNQDGKLDLFITDMHSDMTKPQIKVSNWNLSLAFEKAKSETWCGLDWTPEQRTSATNRMIYGNAFYQKSAPGRFTEVSDQIGVETFWPWGPSVGDLNADGYDDIFVTAGMGYPFRRSEERRVGKECRSRCDWSSDVCSSDLGRPSREPQQQIA